MTDDLDSSSRGIWVFPYDPTSEAGPSKPRVRPLKDIYVSSLRAYRTAYEVYEDERGESQLDDLTDWLNLSLESHSQFHRLPVAILQNPAKKVHGQIKSILGDKSEVVGVQGRDIVDIGSGVRAIASSLVGEVPSKSGVTGLDFVEGWYKARKGSPIIILHIQDAQVISPQVLGELIYIICLHPNIPFRLLLSVPSTSTFLSTWQLIEPSSIDLTILRGGRRGNALSSMLETKSAKVSVGDELASALKKDEGMFGTGPEGALKAIQWEMLHHSVNSPLATLAQSDNTRLAEIEAIIASSNDDIPGKNLFQLSAGPDLPNVTDPSPRISILHALGNTSSFTSHLPSTHTVNANGGHVQSSPSTPKKRKSRHTETMDQDTEEPANQKGDLEHLEVLYNLWKGAGKQVNLWDWLQGYKNHITGQGEDENEDEVDNDGDTERQEDGEGKKRKRKLADVDEDGIHASFVRFCEEARMLGMVRARGKGVGRKADEVVKGVTLL